MWRKRELTVSVRKKPRKAEGNAETPVEDDIEVKNYVVLIPKLFVASVAALYGYVLLDTYRQVRIAQSTYDPDD